MRKIKDVLRLKLQAQLSHERIAAALGLSKGVVTKYCTLAAACGLDWPMVATLSEAALERRGCWQAALTAPAITWPPTMARCTTRCAARA